jgi:hypothetical protein
MAKERLTGKAPYKSIANLTCGRSVESRPRVPCPSSSLDEQNTPTKITRCARRSRAKFIDPFPIQQHVVDDQVVSNIRIA